MVTCCPNASTLVSSRFPLARRNADSFRRVRFEQSSASGPPRRDQIDRLIDQIDRQLRRRSPPPRSPATPPVSAFVTPSNAFAFTALSPL